MARTEESRLIEQYRNLLGALLEHSHLDNEGTECAIGDFVRSGDVTADILQRLIRAQQEAAGAGR